MFLSGSGVYLTWSLDVAGIAVIAFLGRGVPPRSFVVSGKIESGFPDWGFWDLGVGRR